MRRKNDKNFAIALSGISCAIAVIFLTLGVLSDVLLATGYVLGVVALMLPLAMGFYMGDFLAYLGTCVLTLILGAVAKFWDVVPFIMFFGLHPLANALQRRYKINFVVAYIVKAVWFDCTLIAGYFLVYGGILGGNALPQEIYDFVNKYIYVLIFTVGTALFALYDFLIFRFQDTCNYIMRRIKR